MPLEGALSTRPRRQKTVGRPSARQVIFVFTGVFHLEGPFPPQVSGPCVYKCARFDVKVAHEGSKAQAPS